MPPLSILDLSVVIAATPPAQATAPSSRNRARLFVGSRATIVEKLTPSIEAAQAHEAMVMTRVFDHAARRHSYELLAQAFGLSK